MRAHLLDESFLPIEPRIPASSGYSDHLSRTRVLTHRCTYSSFLSSPSVSWRREADSLKPYPGSRDQVHSPSIRSQKPKAPVAHVLHPPKPIWLPSYRMSRYVPHASRRIYDSHNPALCRGRNPQSPYRYRVGIYGPDSRIARTASHISEDPGR